MGKQKYIKEIEHLVKKSPVVSYSSISRIVSSKKGSKLYTKQLVRNLVLKGIIKKLTKGYYTVYNDPSLVVYCFKPSYLGLQDAVSFHNLWEQETVPIVITARKVRPGIRKVLGANVLIKRIDRKYLFGFDYHKVDDFYIPYSDVEKTYIDMIYFDEHMGKELVDNIRRKINRKKLLRYLKIYNGKIKQKVL